MVNTVAPKKAIRKSAKPQVKIPMFNVVERLRRNEELVDTTVTFHFLDGTTKTQPIRKEFVLNEKGRARQTIEILEDLNALVHDNGAMHYTIE